MVLFSARRAWWAVVLVNITNSLAFGAHDTTILTCSLIADIALPVLLLVQVPAFFGKRTSTVSMAREPQ